MTVSSPPFVLEASSHDSRVPRQLAAATFGVDLLTAFNTSLTAFNKGCGVVHSDDFKVKQAGSPNMTVLVEGGICIVRGKFASFNQGVYSVASDTTDVSLAITATDGANPRKDLIIVQVRDQTWGGDAANDCRLLVVTGTPAASPADPSLAAFNAYFVLARVNVGAGVTSITNANIDDLRYMCGPVFKGTSTRRAALVMPADYEGLKWWDTDTDQEFQWNGTLWNRTVGRTGGIWRRPSQNVTSIAGGTWNIITWDTEDVDTDGFLTPSSTTATIPTGKAGVYSIQFTANGLVTSTPIAMLIQAGATGHVSPSGAGVLPGSVYTMDMSIVVYLNATDQIVCEVDPAGTGPYAYSFRLEVWKLS